MLSQRIVLKTKSRGRPQASRDKILKAAEFLFSSRGYQETTLRDLAFHSGANSALISYYFGNKEGLRQAILKEHAKKLESVFEALLSKKIDKKSLESEISQILKAIEEDHTLFRPNVWGPSMLQADKDHQEFWNVFLKGMKGLLQKTMGKKLKEQDLYTRSIFLYGLFHQYAEFRWTCIHKVKETLPIDSDELIESYKKFFLKKVIYVFLY